MIIMIADDDAFGNTCPIRNKRAKQILNVILSVLSKSIGVNFKLVLFDKLHEIYQA